MASIIRAGVTPASALDFTLSDAAGSDERTGSAKSAHEHLAMGLARLPLPQYR